MESLNEQAGFGICSMEANIFDSGEMDAEVEKKRFNNICVLYHLLFMLIGYKGGLNDLPIDEVVDR